MQGNLDKAIELTKQAVELSGDDFPEIGEYLEELLEEKEGGSDDEDDKEDEDDGDEDGDK